MRTTIRISKDLMIEFDREPKCTTARWILPDGSYGGKIFTVDRMMTVDECVQYCEENYGRIEMTCEVDVYNAPEEVSNKYIVATLVDGELWYYGAYKTISAAENARRELYDQRIILRGKER